MKMLNKKNMKHIGIFIIISIGILKFFNTPYNFYSIINWNYEKRMEQNYGYCQKESWGFYNEIDKKFNLNKKRIRIINDEGHITLENLFSFNKSLNNNFEYLIILNYQSENDENIYKSKKYNFIKDLKLIFRKNNCYLFKSND
jgi:hypothetical protein